jgi:hypothetical protein
MKIPKYDFSLLLNQIRGFEELLGLEDSNVIEDARILLRSQFPVGDHASVEKSAYLTRSTTIQENLINLLSRVNYILHQARIEKQRHYGKLLYHEEFEGRKDEKELMAMSQDDKYLDLCITVGNYEAFSKTIDSLLWSIKGAMSKVP